MRHDRSSAPYPPGAKAFHWITAVAVMAAWGLGIFSVYLRGDIPRGTTVSLHKSIAATVLFIAAMRLVYRYVYRNRYPALPAALPRMQRTAAHGTHVMLYVVAMIAAPLSGWYWSSVAGRPIRMLGTIPLPPLAAADPTLYDIAKTTHFILVWCAGLLILLHLLAVVKHVLIDRDHVLRRMAPAFDQGGVDPASETAPIRVADRL